MTAIYRAWEPFNLSPIGGAGFNTNAGGPLGGFRPEFARGQFTAGAGPGQYNAWRLPAYYGIFSPLTFWFHAQISLGGFAIFGNGNAIFFNDANNRPRLGLGWGGFTGLAPIKDTGFGSSGATYLNDPPNYTITIPLGRSQLDMFVDYGTSGSMLVYINNDLLLDLSGINMVAGDPLTGFSGFDIGSGLGYSEVIWDTQDTRTWSLATQAPTVAGNVDQWFGGVNDVDEPGLNDSTINYTATNNLLQQYGVNGLPAGTWNVVDTTLAYRSVVGASGPSAIEGIRRTQAIDYATATIDPGLGWTNSWDTSAINPATGVAWTQGDLNAPGYNIGVKSLS